MDPEKQKEIEIEKQHAAERQAMKERVVARERERREKDEKNKPKPLTPTEIKKKEKEEAEKYLQEIREGKEPDWTFEEIQAEFKSKRDLRKCFKEIIKIQPCKNSDVRDALNWTGQKKQHGYDMFDLLKDMGLVMEVPVLHIWAKEFTGQKLSGIEKDIMKKFNFWTKSIKEDRKNAYVGLTHYWILTELGKRALVLVCAPHITQDQEVREEK